MSSAAELGLHDEISPAGLIDDFRVAVAHAQEIGEFESWILKPAGCIELFDRIEDNPAEADGAVAIGGLASLLRSGAEQARIAEIVEDSSVLNLDRFVGRKATVEGQEGSIHVIGYRPVMGYAVGKYSTTSTTETYVEGKIGALRPSRGRIDISKGYRNLGFTSPTYYHVFPLDDDGQQVAEFKIR